MKVLATALADDVSLLLVEEASRWRFSGWSRVSDGSLLPAPPEASRAKTFATPADAASHFLALCQTDPTARTRMGLEYERDSLVASIREGGVSPADRWAEAQRKLK
ncbi:MAG TPA: hypothetical protein VL049_08405 [Candidatus Dormibacteraeota bacterium]|nr:hypothetical protein [Candidatus Dormibacteraeota bacterium]